MNKVLVTGATGFIGRHCLSLLSPWADEIHAMSSHEHVTENQIHWHHVDLFNQKQVMSVIEKMRPTHLLHLAWYAEHGKFWTSPENHKWVEATESLFSIFQECGGRRIVAAGTCAEYDWTGSGVLSEIGTKLSPATLYGVSKLKTAKYLENLSKETGISSAWGRIFFTYGPNEPSERLVPSVIRPLLRGESALCSSGEQKRDFLYNQDVAAAFVALLKTNAAGAVNIASGQAVAVKEIVSVIGNKIGHPELINLGGPVNEPKLLVADVNRLKNEVLWNPKFSLSEGLDKTIAWWKEHENYR